MSAPGLDDLALLDGEIERCVRMARLFRAGKTRDEWLARADGFQRIKARLGAPSRATKIETQSYQDRVWSWALECFGPELTYGRAERAHRFFEEATELAQSVGCTREDARQLVDYVFDRLAGLPSQETGGVLTTLAALCGAISVDMRQAGEDELARVLTPEVMERVRAKNAVKLRSSPLPGQIAASHPVGGA